MKEGDKAARGEGRVSRQQQPDKAERNTRDRRKRACVERERERVERKERKIRD